MNCRLTVNSALRKLGVLAAGREARSVDLDDGFDALKGMYRQLITNGAFGKLRDVIPVADYTACGNERIFRNTEDVVSITLPETIGIMLYTAATASTGFTRASLFLRRRTR